MKNIGHLNHNLLCSSVLEMQIPHLNIFPLNRKIFHSVGLAIARQHPGEAVGSWMMEGFMHELLSRQYADVMWVIVPMVNPDGVYLGNSRTGLAGYDYNRLYNQEEPIIADREKLSPEVVALLLLVKKLKKKFGSKFRMFIDFHGHSSRQNVFTYGPPYIAGTEDHISGILSNNTVSQTFS
jgi:hypothetical protein